MVNENKGQEVPKFTPIICIDFDGVIHSYTSGWQGPRTIPDIPVAGALEWLAMLARSPYVQPAIYSSRSKFLFGRWAMRTWLLKWYCDYACEYDETPEWWRSIIAETAFADQWTDEVRYAARLIVDKIQFPRAKPPAFYSLDDRCQMFTGQFPEIEKMLAFKPWYKKD